MIPGWKEEVQAEYPQFLRERQRSAPAHAGLVGFLALLALARYEYVRIDADALKTGERPSTVHAGLLGLNWYINRHVRFQLNYLATDIDPKTNTSRRGGGGDVAHEGIAEVQVGF